MPFLHSLALKNFPEFIGDTPALALRGNVVNMWIIFNASGDRPNSQVTPNWTAKPHSLDPWVLRC
ncbi:hypothetical protein Pogu_1172 [Pyrobaculum oguniense TE7]|uniref:Uncharacterized protein n=1 Tax=Pyrobaculum oguniense (strain DSM 13380 / JCM 10595 / TE7) TaxID=698757 RepID=H6Q8P4_PYROT|nr:hypothetical protein Pogu_1172 [Pyrobaculum oguniense TE7]